MTEAVQPRLHLTHSRAVLLMIAVALMWSIAGVVTRQLEHARAFEVTFWRALFTALSLLVILPLLKGRRVFAQMHWRSGAFWVSGVCWSVMFTAFMVAITMTTVANVLVTMSVGPLLTALLTRVFIRHKLPARTWCAIVVAGVGIGYMFGSQLNLGQSDALAGCLVALCVPFAGAVHWTVVQRGQARGEQIDLVPCVLVGAVISALATLPLAMPFVATGRDVAWLALLGLVQLAIPCTLSVICARVLKAPEISLLALLEVIFGIALAWLGAHEAPSQTVLVGGALVLGALLCNEMLAWKERT
jgi:drug/metabolite transporter (DMT)-like permease